jgi:hypothetical protein
VKCPNCKTGSIQKNVFDDGGPISICQCQTCGALVEYLAAIGWIMIGYWIPKKQPKPRTVAMLLRSYGLKYSDRVEVNG